MSLTPPPLGPSRRRLLIVALVAYAVLGVMPVFLTDLTAIIASRVGVMEGFSQVAVGFVPLAGTNVEIGDIFRCEVLPQALAQQIAEQVVIAIPVARLIQGHNEQVGLLQYLQQLLAGIFPCHCIA